MIATANPLIPQNIKVNKVGKRTAYATGGEALYSSHLNTTVDLASGNIVTNIDCR